MKTFFVLICSLALMFTARGGKEQKSTTSSTKTSQRVQAHSSHAPAQTSQHAVAHIEHPATNTHVQYGGEHTHRAVSSGGNAPRSGEVTREIRTGRHTQNRLRDTSALKDPASAPPTPVYHYNFRTKSGLTGRDFSRPLTSDEQSAIARQLENGPPEGTHGAKAGYESENGVYHYNFRTKSGLIGRDFSKPLTAQEQSSIAREMEKGQPEATQVSSGVPTIQGKANPFRPQHFTVPTKSDPAIAGVKFEGTGHIPGSETWTDPKYAAFHDYHHEWHDKNWWEHHPNPLHCRDSQFFRAIGPTPHRVTVLVYGGWYRWYGGYWYPAWGYDPQNNYYPYDGPIYGYNGLAPDQVVANVQAMLQGLGYYDGPINGILDPATRAAISNYQQDHGLYATSAIDEPTLAALGMA